MLIRKKEERIMGRKKKMPFWKKLVIACISAAVVLSGTMAVIVLLFFFSPKRQLMTAIRNTYNEEYMSQGNYLEQETGIFEMIQALGKDGGTTSLNLNLSSPASGSEDSINLLYNDVIDKNEKRMAGNLELSAAEDNTVSASYYGDEKNTYLHIDGLTDGYLKFENENFSDKFNNSALADTLGTIDEYSIDRFSTRQSAAGTGKTSPMTSEKDSFSILRPIEGILKDAKVTKAGSASVDINGEKVKCNRYTVTISKEMAGQILSSMTQGGPGEAGQGQTSYKARPGSTLKVLKQLLENQTGSQTTGGTNGYDYSYGFSDGYGSDFNFSFMMPGQGQGQMPGQGQGQPAQRDLIGLLQAGFSEDVNLTVYVSDKLVRAFEIDTKLSNEENTDIKLTCKNTGSKFITSGMDINIKLGSETITLWFDQKKSDDILSLDAELSTSGERSLNASLYQTLDTSSKDIEGRLKLETAETSYDINYDGNLKKLKKGKNITLDIDSVDITKSGEKLISINGSAGLSTSIDEDIQKFDNTEKIIDVFGSPEGDGLDFAATGSGNLNSFVQSVLSILGKLKGSQQQPTQPDRTSPYSNSDPFSFSNPFSDYSPNEGSGNPYPNPFSGFGGPSGNFGGPSGYGSDEEFDISDLFDETETY